MRGLDLELRGAVGVEVIVVGVQDVQECAIHLICGFDNDRVGAVEQRGLLFGDGVCCQIFGTVQLINVIHRDAGGDAILVRFLGIEAREVKVRDIIGRCVELILGGLKSGRGYRVDTHTY
jgi:hypothetical protein